MRELHLGQMVRIVLLAALVSLTALGGGGRRQSGFGVSPALARSPDAPVSAAKTDQATFDPRQEAGIAAYYKAPKRIDLAAVKAHLKVVEWEDPAFVLGKTDANCFEPYIYAGRDGWILVYFAQTEPVSAAFGSFKSGGKDSKTLLETRLREVADWAEVNQQFGVRHWDFRTCGACPSGSSRSIKIIVEKEGTYGFEAEWPTICGYCDVGFYAYDNMCIDGFHVNGHDPVWRCSNGRCTGYGYLVGDDALPGRAQRFDTSWWAALLTIEYCPPGAGRWPTHANVAWTMDFALECPQGLVDCPRSQARAALFPFAVR